MKLIVCTLNEIEIIVSFLHRSIMHDIFCQPKHVFDKVKSHVNWSNKSTCTDVLQLDNLVGGIYVIFLLSFTL